MWEKLKELYEPHDGTTKLHTLDASFNMCVSQEEEEFFIFLATYEEAMDDAITASNLIPQDIKIGLEQNKLLELWGKFITMNSNIKSLPKLLTTIRHEDTRRQEKVTNQPMAKAISINRYQPVNSLSQIKQVTKIMDNEVIHMALNKVELQGDMVVL